MSCDELNKLKQIITQEEEVFDSIVSDLDKMAKLNDDENILGNIKHIKFYLQATKRNSVKKAEIVSDVIEREELKKSFSVIRPKSR